MKTQKFNLISLETGNIVTHCFANNQKEAIDIFIKAGFDALNDYIVEGSKHTRTIIGDRFNFLNN